MKIYTQAVQMVPLADVIEFARVDGGEVEFNQWLDQEGSVASPTARLVDVDETREELLGLCGKWFKSGRHPGSLAELREVVERLFPEGE